MDIVVHSNPMVLYHSSTTTTSESCREDPDDVHNKLTRNPIPSGRGPHGAEYDARTANLANLYYNLTEDGPIFLSDGVKYIL